MRIASTKIFGVVAIGASLSFVVAVVVGLL